MTETKQVQYRDSRIVEIKEERPVWFSRFASRLVANIAQRPELFSEDLAEFFDLEILRLLQIHSMHILSVDSVTAFGTQYRHIFSIDKGAFCADLALAAFEHGVGKTKIIE